MTRAHPSAGGKRASVNLTISPSWSFAHPIQKLVGRAEQSEESNGGRLQIRTQPGSAIQMFICQGASASREGVGLLEAFGLWVKLLIAVESSSSNSNHNFVLRKCCTSSSMSNDVDTDFG